MRIKSVYSLALSKQKKNYFDVIKIQGETENSFKINYEEEWIIDDYL